MIFKILISLTLITIIILLLFPKKIKKTTDNLTRNATKYFTMKLLNQIFKTDEKPKQPQQDNRKEGEVKIERARESKKNDKNPGYSGEYVNFDEIKD